MGLPLPAGKGGGGMGERKQAKGKVSRRSTGQTTLWAPPTPAAPGDLPDKPPIGHLLGRDYKCRRRFSAGVPGAKPPAKLTYGLPLPAGKGAGGMGERKQAKGRVGGRQSGHAPRRVSLTPAAPATPRQAPRRGTHPAHRRTYPLFLSQNYCNREKYVVKCYGEDSLVP